MPRRFFVGGNFKLNPSTVAASESLIDVLNNADLDPETGKEATCILSFDRHLQAERSIKRL